MAGIPSHLMFPRNGGSDSIRSTVSLGFTAPFALGIVVCVGSDGVLRSYGNCNSNDPILGIVEKLHPPMNTEVDVVLSGIVNLDFIESGKNYFLNADGTLGNEGTILVMQGIGKGRGVFTRPTVSVTHASAPVGTLMTSWSTDVPFGWLECNGSFIASNDYPALFAASFGNHESIKVKTVSGSENILVFAYNGIIPENTTLNLSAHGLVVVMSCRQGLLVVTSSKPFTLLQTAPQSLQELTSADPNGFFLPTKVEPPFKWIVKT